MDSQVQNSENTEKETAQEIHHTAEIVIPVLEAPQSQNSEQSTEKEKKKKQESSKQKGDQSGTTKEQKVKRKIKNIIGLNSTKDVIVQFADSDKPEVVSNAEMKSMYCKELLNFYESKIEIIPPTKSDQ